MNKGSKNSDSTLLVNDGKNQQQNSSLITTSNPKTSVNNNGIRQYTWNEIRQHASKTDRWLVIDKRVYDITRWTKHPGGQNVLKHYGGQDATEAFRAFHRDLSYIEKYLKTFYIGDVLEKEEEPNCSIEDQKLRDDFERLRQIAISRNLFQSSPWFFILVALHILILEFAAYFILFRFGISWIPYLAALLCYTIAEAQTGWIQHDFGHLSIFKSTAWNHALHQFFFGFVKGASSDWWNNMHFQHHSKPNVIDKDPDTRIDPLFLLGDTIPIRKAQNNAKYGKKMPYNFQHLYFFVVAPLLFPVYFQFMSMRHPITRRKWLDLFCSSLFYVKFFSLVSLKLGLWGAFKFHFVLRALEGSWFVLVAQSNHVVMNVSDDDSSLSWFRMQLRATCNIAKSSFNDWFTGHLNFQIEHHLFPTMPRHNLYKIQPEVRQICQKYNIPYIVKPMGQAFLDILLSLEKSGRMWLEAYDELIQSARIKAT